MDFNANQSDTILTSNEEGDKKGFDKDESFQLAAPEALAFQEELAKEDAERRKLLYIIHMEDEAIERAKNTTREIQLLTKSLESKHEQNVITIKNLKQHEMMALKHIELQKHRLRTEQVKVEELTKELAEKESKKEKLIQRFAEIQMEVEEEMKVTRDKYDEVIDAIKQGRQALVQPTSTEEAVTTQEQVEPVTPQAQVEIMPRQPQVESSKKEAMLN
ncbi:hypothetical protein HDE_11533 [Halotydeus destructor]|nr:hypothetical protein HDE_11533 [Halotydeus destructor]